MIRCRALADKSIYVTATGDVLPCCFVHRGGINLTPALIEIIKDKNFEGLTVGWNSPTPYQMCANTCDDTKADHPGSIVNFDKQWKND